MGQQSAFGLSSHWHGHRRSPYVYILVFLSPVLTLLLSDLCSRFQQPRLLPDRHRLGVGDRHRHVLGVCGVLRALEDCEEGIVAALGVCTADEGGLDGGVERKGLGVIP